MQNFVNSQTITKFQTFSYLLLWQSTKTELRPTVHSHTTRSVNVGLSTGVELMVSVLQHPLSNY